MKTKMEIRLIQGNATFVAQLFIDDVRVEEQTQTIVVPNMISEKTETRSGVYYGPFEGVFDVGEKPKTEKPKKEEKPRVEDETKEVIVEAPS
jgi:hypothetical protein